ncbi:MAG: synthase subunit delta [Gammaproteobacteria bacterium]|jgi:F-type H+-transporting ATPase subunit delta|nr:synthase subunit delta [Gammaproteobacteria bacterium]
MIDFTTAGRPYAQAAFEYAQENNALDVWQLALSTLADTVLHPEVEALLKNPSYDAAQRADLCRALVPQKLDASQQNFIRLLSEHARLPALPAIFSLFVELRAEAEKVLPINIKTAMPLDDADLRKLNAFLTAKFERKVNLEVDVDENLIGGVLIRAGDYVIDGSVRGQFERLKSVVVD